MPCVEMPETSLKHDHFTHKFKPCHDSHTSLCMCAAGFAVPHEKALFTLSPGAHNQHDLSSYSQLSHHAFQQYQLGGIPEGHPMNSDSGLLTGGPLWDAVQPAGSYSVSPGHQPGSSPAGVWISLINCYRLRTFTPYFSHILRMFILSYIQEINLNKQSIDYYNIIVCPQG